MTFPDVNQGRYSFIGLTAILIEEKQTTKRSHGLGGRQVFCEVEELWPWTPASLQRSDSSAPRLLCLCWGMTVIRRGALPRCLSQCAGLCATNMLHSFAAIVLAK